MRAPLWPIMTWWQLGPCTVCTSHIWSVGLRYIKGYLVHKAHISPALELKEAYMAKFGVWQIMILWQFGPQTVCTSHIRSVGPRVFSSYSSYTRLTVESKSGIWSSLGCCRSHKRGRPYGRLRFRGSLDHVLYLPAILGLWVQGLLGTYNPNTPILVNEKCIYGQVSGIPIPINWRVFEGDVHFVVGRGLYYSCHE